MAKFFPKLLIVALVLFASPIPALAVGDDVFVVPRVAVQAQASNATAAKATAQRQGRRRAMDILLRRLTIEEDWVYLPRLATGEPAESGVGFERSAIALDDAGLEKLESGFEVYSEKSSSSTYRAFITYRFKPVEVRRLLKDASIPYSEAQTRTALVIPVLETASNAYLWEENNPWLSAWKVRPYNNELTPMIAPLGDLEDTAAISARQALAINKGALTAIGERYSVPQVIVAHAYLRQRDGMDQVRVRLINGYRESAAIETSNDLAADRNFGPAPTSVNDSAKAVFNSAVGDVLAEAWYSQPSGNFPALAERAIEETIAKYAKPWKERTLIDHSIASVLNVSAYYGSLSEWAKIRSALVSTPLVGSVQVKALSRGGAEMLIQAFGDPDKLVVAMESQGLVLWNDAGDDYWNVATPSSARNARNLKRSQYQYDEGQAPLVQPAIFPAVEGQ